MPEQNKDLLDKMFKDKVNEKEKENLLKESDIFDIVMVVDRSGSMSSIRNDAIGGVNTFIDEQEKEDNNNTFVSMVQFDDVYGEPQYWRIPIKKVDRLTEQTFIPRGMTALLDAIGKTIAKVRELRASGEIKGKVQFVVQTDGGENASKEYTEVTQIGEMITEIREEGWGEFIFLGANIDAFSVGGGFGISSAHTVNFAHTGGGVRGATYFASAQTKNFRYGDTMDASVLEDMQTAIAAGDDVEELYNRVDANINRGDVEES